MARRNAEPTASTGQLDRVHPKIREFSDGKEVSRWMNILREGASPTVDLLDQLKAAGWDHFFITKLEEVLDNRRRQSIGYGTIHGILNRPGRELEVEVTDTNGRKTQVALCRNEYTLLHGYTTNYRGPERRVRLKMATSPGVFGGMLIARQ